jgi:enterochelin esterase-like enzyme
MPEVPAPILWDENVDMVPYYHEQDATTMSYLLYTPTNIQEGQKLPLLIWLHGDAERNVDEATFRTSGLPAVLESMELTPNAFILCPQMDGAYDLGTWNNEGALVAVTNLVNCIVANNPAIDVENISLSGIELGGTGALYMAQSMEYLNKVAPMSSYTASVVLPIGATAKFFVGSTAHGEDGTCVDVAKSLESEYEVFYFDCSQDELPTQVFKGNDVFTWLLTK